MANVFDDLGLPSPDKSKSVFDELGLPKPGPAPEAPKASRTISDWALTLGRGAASGLVTAPGQLVTRMGGNSTVRDAGLRLQEAATEAMSPEGKIIDQSPFLSDKPGEVFGPYPVQKALGSIVESAPGMVGLGVAGRPISAGLQAVNAGAGVAGAITRAGAPSVVGKAAGMVLETSPYWMGEGVQAGGANAAEIGQQIRDPNRTPIEKIARTPAFQQSITESLKANPGWTVEQHIAAAREASAVQAEKQVFDQTAASTGLIGAATGAGAFGVLERKLAGKTPDGFLRSTAKAAGSEALQETAQSGGEQALQNLAVRDYANPDQSLTEGVGEAAALGAITGGVLGGGMAAATPNRAGQPPETPGMADPPIDRGPNLPAAPAEPGSLTAAAQTALGSGAATEVQSASLAQAAQVAQTEGGSKSLDAQAKDAEQGAKPTPAVESLSTRTGNASTETGSQAPAVDPVVEDKINRLTTFAETLDARIGGAQRAAEAARRAGDLETAQTQDALAEGMGRNLDRVRANLIELQGAPSGTVPTGNVDAAVPAGDSGVGAGLPGVGVGDVRGLGAAELPAAGSPGDQAGAAADQAGAVPDQGGAGAVDAVGVIDSHRAQFAKPPSGMTQDEFRGFIAQRRDAEAQAVEQLVAQAADGLQVPARYGGTLMMTPEPTNGGKTWRVTNIMENGEPSGHMEFNSAEDAARDLLSRGGTAVAPPAVRPTADTIPTAEALPAPASQAGEAIPQFTQDLNAAQPEQVAGEAPAPQAPETLALPQAAPTGTPVVQQPAVAKRTREQVAAERKETYRQTNPFKSFLATFGVKTAARSDVGGDKRKPVMVPYHGALFRNNGLNLDELARRAVEAGFLTQADLDSDMDNGGVNKLSDMIRRQLAGENILPIARYADAAEAQYAEAAQAYYEAQAEATDALVDEASDEQINALVRMVRTEDAEASNEEIDYLAGIEADVAAETESTSAVAAPSGDSGSSAPPRAEGADQVGFVLEAPTAEGLRQAAEQQAANEAQQAKRDAAPPAEDFTLTGSNRAADQAAARGQMELAPPDVSIDFPSIESAEPVATSDTTPESVAEPAAIEQVAPVDAAAAEAATSPKNDRPEPSDAQKDAGNYAKGHASVGGLDVTLENEAGTRRRPEWPPLAGHYGYVKRTMGADGDQVDVFINPGTPESYDGFVLLIDQVIDGKFDEHKAMIGWPNQPAAAKAYRDSYTKGWKGLGKVRRMTMAEFKDWLKNGDTTKPAAIGSDSTAKAEAKPIGDFGSKIGGARKDRWQEYADRIKDVDVATEPLSKSWPAPDYAKLIEEGADPWGVAFMHAARDAIPSKPRKTYAAKRWAETVKLLRDTSIALMDGSLSTANARAKLAEFAGLSRGMNEIAGRIELYMAVGHAKSLDGVRVSAGEYTLRNGVEYKPAKVFWTVEKEAAASAFSNWPRELAIGETKAEAIAAFKAKYDSLELTAGPKQTTFEIYGSGGKFHVGKKTGRNALMLAGPFGTVKEARAYREANHAELLAKLERAKEIPRTRRETNDPRVGEDMRDGQDVTPGMFGETFGFRGVEFGNWVEQAKRQHDLNDAFDALMDMAAIMGVPPKALSLNGELGLAFGARGSGGVEPAAAHYERDFVVINLTKKQGAGSIGHEWWHALDNYFARMRGEKQSMLTEALDVSLAARGAEFFHKNPAVRKEMVEAFGAVMRAIKSTALRARASKLDAKRSKEYWTTSPEMSARAFESYLISKLQDHGASNDYLANIVDEATWKAAESIGFELDDSYPYPTAGEIPAIREGFDRFFSTIQTRETDAGVAMFSRGADSGMPAPAVSKIANAIRTAWANGPEVVVVANMQDAKIPQRVRDADAEQRSGGASGDPEGFFVDGKVYLVASALNSDADVARVLAHESLGHYGLRGLFGERLKPILEQIANVRRAEVATKAREYGLDPANRDHQLIAAEEILAVMAQSNPQLGFVRKAIAAIRTWLRDAGLKIAVTDDDIIAQFILPARAFVERGAGTSAAEPQPALSRADAVKKAAADGARAIKGATLQSTWKRLHNAWVDKRPLSIQLLGRRQIVEVYEKLLPELRAYSNEMQQYDADKNESAAAADEIVTRWRKLKDADALAEVMHGATLNEFDPERSKTPRDLLTPEWREVHDGWQALSPEAQAVYREARDAYETHWNLVKKAIGERIERADISENDRRAMMEQYRDEFLKPIEGVYFPLARFGDYVITVKKQGVTQAVVFAETLTEAEAEQVRLTKDFPAAEVGKVTKRKEFNAARDSVSKDFVRKLYETVDREAGPDSEALKDAINQLYLTSLPDVSWAKHGIHRKGTPGYNKDARRAFAANMFHGGYHVAKLRHADVLQDYLRSMQERVDGNQEEAGYDSVAAQQVVDEMVKRHDATINPDNNPAANTATALGFVWYLGASPASALVNLSQTALVAYPIIGAKFGFGKSQAALLKASSEAVKFRNDFRGKLAGDENEAIERAIREGLVDITQAHDLASISEGRDSQLHGALSPVMRVASKLFHEAEKFNRQATFLAAYRLAKGAGESAESAYDTARDLTYRGHFDYAQSNRPRVMMGPIARVILLFKQYGQNMIYTLGRNAVLAAKGDRQALRTLSGILVAHGLAAGTLGLPMSSILFGLASLIGGSDDEPWDAEVAYRNYLADALGPTLGEIVARGVFRGIFPGDVSARVGLDSLLVRDIDLTLSPGKVHQEILNAVLGPVAGIGVNMARGAADLARGDVQRGVEAMLPKAIADGLKTVRYGMEGVKDRTGVDVLSEVKAHELAAQVLGFSPARAKEAYEGRRAALGKEEALKARHNELLADFARALTTNDDEARAETIDKIRRFNESNPTFAITRDGIKRSVQNRLRRQVEAQNGVYLPRKHRDLADEGRFANTQ